MQYTTTINSIEDFDAWSGGKTWLDTFINHPDALAYLDNYLEEWLSCCDQVTDTDINDFLWFEAYNVLKEAGFVDEDLNWKDEEE